MKIPKISPREALNKGLRALRLLFKGPGGFYRFVKWCWQPVFNERFLDGRHIEELCNTLQAMAQGLFDNLIANIPPGHGKSRIVSVLWCAWRLGALGERKDWLCAALAEDLAIRDTEECRDVIKSAWFQRLWGVEFSSSVDAKINWKLKGGGKRHITSARAKGTGKRAHVQVLDDLHELTESPKEMKKSLKWYNTTWASRDNFGYSIAQNVIIMQRVGYSDVTGYVLENEHIWKPGDEIKPGTWVHLCLPLEYDPAHHCVTPVGGDWRTQKGDLLWPQAYGKNEEERRAWVERRKRRLGPRDWAAQYGQRPLREGGKEFQPEWMGHRWPALDVDKVDRWGISIDCTFKDGPAVDNVAIQLIAKQASFYYVVAELVEQMSWDTLKRRSREFYLKWRNLGIPIKLVLIEEAANGYALICELRKDVPGVVGYKHKGDSKLTRARATTGIWAAAQVLLPDLEEALLSFGDGRRLAVDSDFVPDYESEFLAFPDPVAHDDRVDATSQFINYCEDPVNKSKGLPNVGRIGARSSSPKARKSNRASKALSRAG